MDQMEADKLVTASEESWATSTSLHLYAGESTERAFTSAPATRGSVSGQRKAERGNGFLTSSSLRLVPSYAFSPAPVNDAY